MYRCMICDITSTGKLSSNPNKPKKNLKFFVHDGLVTCFDCEYPSSSSRKYEDEDGEIEMLEGEWDD